MKFIILLGFVSAHSPPTRIVGGKVVDMKEYNWMASLRYHGKHHCGGILYRENVIISAAHCLRKDGTEPWRIAIPKSKLLKDSLLYEVDLVIRHPKYDDEVYSNDAALWIPCKNFPVLNTRIVLATRDFASPGKELFIVGWGRTYRSASLRRTRDPNSKTLRKTMVPVISKEKCSKIYDDVDFNSQFCAGLEEGGRDGCEGDSGGPIFFKHDKTYITLVGIMSSGAGCAEPGLPGVYTHANVVVDLLKIMNKFDQDIV